MTAYRVIDDHKELDNIGVHSHDEIDVHVDDSAFLIVSGSTNVPTDARILIPGTGIYFTDGGPGGNFTISVSGSVTASAAGLNTYVQFNDGGNFGADPNFVFNKNTDTLAVTNISGSLTKLSNGTSYLVAGPGISIISQSNGSILITGSSQANPGGLDTYVQFNDGGAFGGDSNFIFNKNANSLTVTNLSGSLTHLSDGTSYLIAGNNITITTGSNGSVVIDSTATGGGGSGDPNATYLVLSTTGSLTNERALVASTGLTAIDGGANSNYTLRINNSVVATISGSTFAGAVKFNGGLSGSLTRLANGSPYLVAGPNVLLTTQSNGSVRIEASGGGGGSGSPGGFDTYVQFNDGGNFGGDSNFIFNKTSNTLTVNNLSGSLTRLANGLPYLIAGSNVTITTGSNGSITINSTGGGTTYTAWVDAVSGVADGVNTSFTLSNTPYPSTSLAFFVNGVLQKQGASLDYTLSGNTINTSLPPNSGSNLLATYQYQATSAGLFTQWMETPLGATDGINFVFTLQNSPSPSSSLMFFVNGVLQKQGSTADYTVTGNTITMNYVPGVGSSISAIYQYSLIPLTGTSTSWMEIPTGDVDGVNMVFSISNSPMPSTGLMFFVNGIMQRQDGIAMHDYSLSGTTIIMNYAPASGSNLIATYPY